MTNSYACAIACDIPRQKSRKPCLESSQGFKWIEWYFQSTAGVVEKSDDWPASRLITRVTWVLWLNLHVECILKVRYGALHLQYSFLSLALSRDISSKRKETQTKKWQRFTASVCVLMPVKWDLTSTHKGWNHIIFYLVGGLILENGCTQPVFKHRK